MTKNFKTLRGKMSAERRSRVEKRVDRILAGIQLQELRKACKVTQEQLAEGLEITQASISKIERQSDMYVSTLRKYVESLGGALQIVVNLPSGSFILKGFSSVK